jgi:hypothetical protein
MPEVATIGERWIADSHGRIRKYGWRRLVITSASVMH